MTRLRAGFAFAAMMVTQACHAAPATYSPQDPASPLQRTAAIALPEVKGRIDHLAIDLPRGLLFVAEYGNGSVDVIDLGAGRVIDRIAGLHEPQGLAVAGAELVVACGDGSVRFYTAAGRKPVASLSLGEDADNVRIDPRNGHIVVGYGSGGLAVIDPATHRVLGRTPLPGHPEGFRLSGSRVLVNLPDRGTIVSADLDSGKIIGTWPTGGYHLNFPMALAPSRQWFAVAYRLPAALQVRGTNDGAVRSTTSACGDADDLFLDHDRAMLVCGAGHVDLVPLAGPGRPARIETRAGARTGLFVPELATLFVAVPRRTADAAIWAFHVGNPSAPPAPPQ